MNSGPLFKPQHYLALARMMRRTMPPRGSGPFRHPERYRWIIMRNEMAAMLRADNPKFNKEAFMISCEPREEVA